MCPLFILYFLAHGCFWAAFLLNVWSGSSLELLSCFKRLKVMLSRLFSVVWCGCPMSLRLYVFELLISIYFYTLASHVSHATEGYHHT